MRQIFDELLKLLHINQARRVDGKINLFNVHTRGGNA